MEASRPRHRGRQRAKAVLEEDEDDYQEAGDGAAYEEQDGMSSTRTLGPSARHLLTLMVAR